MSMCCEHTVPCRDSPEQSAEQRHAHLMCLPVFTTLYGTAHSLGCHSYLQCKYGKRCSGRDLKMTLLRASVMKLINGGMRAEQVLTKQVSLSFSLSLSSYMLFHPFFFTPQPCCPFFPSPSLCPNKAQLHRGSFIHYWHEPGLSLWTPNKC